MIPKKLKVGGVVYKIIQTTKPLLLNNVVCGGIISYTYKTIQIQIKERSHQTSETSFCHEICHAVSDMASVNLDENEITRISNVLYQVIKDNKIRFE